MFKIDGELPLMPKRIPSLSLWLSMLSPAKRSKTRKRATLMVSRLKIQIARKVDTALAFDVISRRGFVARSRRRIRMEVKRTEKNFYKLIAGKFYLKFHSSASTHFTAMSKNLNINWKGEKFLQKSHATRRMPWEVNRETLSRQREIYLLINFLLVDK